MVISSKREVPKDKLVSISGDEIEYGPTYKYLGVWLDEKLDFNVFASELYNKMLSKYHMLKKVSHKLNRQTLSLLHKSLIMPSVDYCSSVLFNFNESQLQKLQKVQNRMMRLILRAGWDTHIIDMQKELGWLSIKQRVTHNTLKFLYKIENEEVPNYLKSGLTV